MKDAYYFSHDSNARNDAKIIKLRIDFGWEGYGLFWALIEILREEKNHEIECDCNAIAFRLQCDCIDIEKIIKNYGLFKIENNKIFSVSLKDRMNLKSEKARKSAEARWNKSDDKDANAMRTQCERNANLCEPHAIYANTKEKEKEKEKEKKEELKKEEYIYTEFTKLKKTDFEKLVSEYGLDDTQRMIETLNNYKGANGKTYKNDFLAIKNWVVDRVKQQPLNKKSLVDHAVDLIEHPERLKIMTGGFFTNDTTKSIGVIDDSKSELSEPF